MKLYSKNNPIPFGKYKGELILSVIDNDPWYVDWAVKTVEWFELDYEAKNLLKEILDIREIKK